MVLMVLAALHGCRVSYHSYELFQNATSEGLYRRAQAFQYNGQLDSALVYFDKADKAAPNTALILHERGLLKSNMTKYNEALIDLNKSIELTTDQELKESRISNRALTYLAMGKIKEACNDWSHSGKSGRGYMEKYCK